MLQQILKDLWVDPELLAELDESMKQTLFCRMREEQVRRWQAWDKEQQEIADNQRKRKVLQSEAKGNNKNHVQFLMADDGNPWVWVMGEHPDDKTVEEILEEEAREKARLQAEKETEELRKNVTVELTELIDYNQRQIEELEKAREKQDTTNDYPMDLYCSVGELQETKRHSIPLNLIQTEEIEVAFQELSVNKPKQVSQRIAQWEQRLLEKRTSQIFQRLKDQRKEAAKQAAEAEYQQENVWREQEKRAKEAEFQIREIARRAREEHRKTLLGNDYDKESLQKESDNISVVPFISCDNESLCSIELGKPSNKIAILEWFHQKEIPRGAGLDDRNKVVSWFHGLITRAEAEMLMNEKPSGTFLVRVSEKIWGYAITYRENGKCKHYLVDASNNRYKFLGESHVCHNTLGELVNYHRKKPITLTGGEILSFECHRSAIPDIFLGIPGILG